MIAEVVSLYPVDRPVRLLVPAKVNLFLDVLDRRPDGYHNLEMVNVSVSLFDEIEVHLRRHGKHEVVCNWPEVPTDDHNHLIKAVRKFLRGTSYRAQMFLKKRIPVGAGLGGGTADAGVLIRYLVRALGLDTSSLLANALSIGSDVPYSIVGGDAHVGGRGDLVARLADMPKLRLVLLDPKQNHKTAQIYGALPHTNDRPHPPLDLFLSAWKKNRLDQMASLMYNAFQPVVFEEFPRLAYLRDKLLAHGCLGVTLTGTGSHLVGLLAPDSPPPRDWKWDEEDTQLLEVGNLPSEFTGWIKRL